MFLCTHFSSELCKKKRREVENLPVELPCWRKSYIAQSVRVAQIQRKRRFGKTNSRRFGRIYTSMYICFNKIEWAQSQISLNVTFVDCGTKRSARGELVKLLCTCRSDVTWMASLKRLREETDSKTVYSVQQKFFNSSAWKGNARVTF